MGPAPARGSLGRPGLSPAKTAILEHLQQRDDSVVCGEVAERFGHHVNTVRKHLDELVTAGLVTRRRATANGRGRPAWLYAADRSRPEPDRRVREYAALAGALAQHLATASEDPVASARSAGTVWGRTIAWEGHPDLPLRSAREARGAVVATLVELGFDPVSDHRVTTAALRRCPLLDVAMRYPEVVCQVHLGLVQGALAELGGDPDRVALMPFSEPGACRLHLLAKAS